MLVKLAQDIYGVGKLGTVVEVSAHEGEIWLSRGTAVAADSDEIGTVLDFVEEPEVTFPEDPEADASADPEEVTDPKESETPAVAESPFKSRKTRKE